MNDLPSQSAQWEAASRIWRRYDQAIFHGGEDRKSLLASEEREDVSEWRVKDGSIPDDLALVANATMSRYDRDRVDVIT